MPDRRLCKSRRLPWSRRLAPGGGCPTRPPLQVAADRHGRGPEERGRLRPDGYSGLRRVWGLAARAGELGVRHTGNLTGVVGVAAPLALELEGHVGQPEARRNRLSDPADDHLGLL